MATAAQFRSLQAGRALAAAAVAAFHLSGLMGEPDLGGSGTASLRYLFERGYLGVDFFFVLSGFIILQAHVADIGRPRQAFSYLSKRFVRIYPVYWLYLSACIAGMAFVGSEHLGLHSIGEVLSTYALLRLVDSELPLGQAWTLFHEVMFYLLFVTLVMNRRLGIAVFIAWMAGIFWWLATAELRYVGTNQVTWQSALVGGQNVGFLVGMAAYALCRRIATSPRWRAVLVLLSGIVLFCGAYRIHGFGDEWRSDWAMLARVGYALSFGLIVAGCAALERAGALSVPAWAALVGDASYSIYLLHIHTESYLLRALRAIGISIADPGEQIPVFVLVLGATIAVGCAAYLLVERPLVRALRRRVDRRRTRLMPDPVLPNPSAAAER